MSDSEEDLGVQLKGLKIARHLKESGEHTDEESNSSPEHDCGLSNQDDLTVMHTQAKEEVFKRREEDGTRTEDALHEGEAGKEGTGFPHHSQCAVLMKQIAVLIGPINLVCWTLLNLCTIRILFQVQSPGAIQTPTLIQMMEAGKRCPLSHRSIYITTEAN